MRYAISLVMGSLLLAGVPAHAKPGPRIDAEAKLAKALVGRVAGEPVDCLNLRDIRSSQIINRTAILYETRGGVVYVNRPDAGASSLTDWDVMVTDTHSSQLCSIDVVHLYDSGLRMQTGVVFLGDFVPYKKAKSGRGW
jgi:hypothetical protein